MEMVFAPVFRLTWWPAVWLSASAGVMVTAALASAGVAVTVGAVVGAATEAVYLVALEMVPMSLPEMSSANRSALSDRLAKVVRVTTPEYVLVVVPLVTVTLMVLSPVSRLIWWPAVWLSASAGVMATVAPAAATTATAVVDVVVWGTRTSKPVRPCQTGEKPMSMPVSSSDCSKA